MTYLKMINLTLIYKLLQIDLKKMKFKKTFKKIFKKIFKKKYNKKIF